LTNRFGLALLLLGAALGLPGAVQGADGERPVCNGKHVGELWPTLHPTDRVANSALIRSGRIEVCVHPGWHYRWQSLVVDARELRRVAAAKAREHHETEKPETGTDSAFGN
jgi:hypothetical protein